MGYVRDGDRGACRVPQVFHYRAGDETGILDLGKQSKNIIIGEMIINK